jgi:hypothetical protein
MTTSLSQSAFGAARQFLNTQARPLDAARFRFHFEQGSSTEVLSALAPYQNPDGGFGHGLEPDFRAPQSSVLCTSIALQILRELGGCPDAELTQRAIAFSVSTLNPTQNTWRIIPKHADDSAPHAPWWNQDQDTEEADAGDDSFSLNPSAEMLGYLYDYKAQVPDGLAEPIAHRVLLALSKADTIEMHDLLCCLRLFNTASLPKDVGDRLKPLLADLIPSAVDTDPETWSGYGLRPLQVIDRPDSPFMTGLEAVVAANVEYAIASQHENGSWLPTWSWGDQFPDAWAIAQTEWAGALTLDMLLTLQRFGKLDNP